MVTLVAGVVSASLVLVYLSIAVSILAAVTLGAGVLLRRREPFGDAGAGGTQRGWAAADPASLRSAVAGFAGTGPSGAAQMAGDRARAGRGGGRGDRQDHDDLAERVRKATASSSARRPVRQHGPGPPGEHPRAAAGGVAGFGH